MNNLNVKIPIDTSIGIYGESGVGKSTFLNVFLRLLEPQSGKILVDGQDILDQIEGMAKYFRIRASECLLK